MPKTLLHRYTSSPRAFPVLASLYPPLLGSGIRIRHVAPDWTRGELDMHVAPWTANTNGTAFGGALFAATDVLYGALLAIGQQDLMRLIAYTSVSHFGFIVLGIFAFTTVGGAGATLYMVNHGFTTAGLFLVAGMLIVRRGSRDLRDFGGWQRVTPLIAGATAKPRDVDTAPRVAADCWPSGPASSCSHALATENTTPPSAVSGGQVELSIGGMTCAACASRW